jgi:serine protease Do
MNKYLSLILFGAQVCLVSLGAKEEVKLTGSCNHCGNSLSSANINVVKKCRGAVVYIETKYTKESNHFSFNKDNQGYFGFDEDLLEKFFGFQEGGKAPEKEQPKGSGSGFIVSQDGYIITNHHVVKDADQIMVEIYQGEEGKEYKAELVGSDVKTDIAVLKIEEKNLPYLEFADSNELEPGQFVIAIGHPLRLKDTVTAGVISAKNRMNLQITHLEDFVQSDVSLSPGSSGSPLLDLTGKVVAVNTAIIPPSHKNMGVGFSVPSNIALMVFEHIKEKGIVNRGFLGVNIQDLTEDLIEGFGLKKGTKGALISNVTEGSAGEIAGLKQGDLVISFNNEMIKNANAFANHVGKLPAGKKCEIIVLRDGKKLTLNAELGSFIPEIASSGNIIHKIGVTVEEITENNTLKYKMKSGESAVVIKEVIPGSLAYKSGWKEGSIIMVINGEKIKRVEDLVKALEKSNKGKKLVALLNHNGNTLFTSITTP